MPRDLAIAIAICNAGEEYQEAHEEHMDLNDECPWCGACR